MNELFYVFGGALTAAALILSFVGLRSERFPGSGPAFKGILAVMGVLVVLSCGFAVALAREEQEHRQEEIAEFRAEEAEEAPEENLEPLPEQDTVQEPDVTLELTSPQDGSLVFDTDRLTAPPGDVRIDYTNPSQVPHNVAIEEGDETLSQGDTVTGGSVSSATAELAAGEYQFYCSIAGHREAGMEGVLLVE